MASGITGGVDMVRVLSTGIAVAAPLLVVVCTWLRAVAGDQGKVILRAVYTVAGTIALATVTSFATWYVLKGYAGHLFGLAMTVWYFGMAVLAAGHTKFGYVLMTSEQRPRQYGAKLFSMPTRPKPNKG